MEGQWQTWVIGIFGVLIGGGVFYLMRLVLAQGALALQVEASRVELALRRDLGERIVANEINYIHTRRELDELRREVEALRDLA